MRTITVAVDEGEENERLDSFLAKKIRKLSRSAVARLIKEGAIVLNEKSVTANQKTKSGETFTVNIPAPEPLEAEPENIPLDIVYEDDDIIVVNKQAGLVVHPAKGNSRGTLVNALLYHCKNLSGIGGKLRPGIVHRLDKDTSGLIAIAKNDEAHHSLSEQLKSRSMGREYVAIVRGLLKKERGIINDAIGRHPQYRKKMSIRTEKPREALTEYEVIERFAEHTYVRLRLKTGRTHQIRVHLSSKNHPVLGDMLYGKQKTGLIDRPALHARKMTLIHPKSGEKMEFEASIPGDIEELLAQLRKQGD
ncbi:MAG: RluA family pseudouridine synthase [Nitrospinota bacterium]|nr:RluA family pseudouridine synthase [Nitrospinota bacterium]